MMRSYLHNRMACFYKFFWRIGVCSSLMLCACWLWCLPVGAAEPGLRMEEISFVTEDHVTISGSWIVGESSESRTKYAVIILLHDYGFDRRDWGIFIPELVEREFRVLAIDLRGHGQSIGSGMRMSGKYSFETSSVFLNLGLLDLQGALKWLKERHDVNMKAISLIGVGAGGDLAYVGARQLAKRIHSAVVISPSLVAVSEGSFISDRSARAVLFCTSSGDSNGSSMMAAESLANFTDSPKKVVIYPSNAHGLSMFYKHPEITREILTWLGQ